LATADAHRDKAVALFRTTERMDASDGENGARGAEWVPKGDVATELIDALGSNAESFEVANARQSLRREGLVEFDVLDGAPRDAGGGEGPRLRSLRHGGSASASLGIARGARRAVRAAWIDGPAAHASLPSRERELFNGFKRLRLRHCWQRVCVSSDA
jgi:hypothetical protein